MKKWLKQGLIGSLIGGLIGLGVGGIFGFFLLFSYYHLHQEAATHRVFFFIFSFILIILEEQLELLPTFGAEIESINTALAIATIQYIFLGTIIGIILGAINGFIIGKIKSKKQLVFFILGMMVLGISVFFILFLLVRFPIILAFILIGVIIWLIYRKIKFKKQ